MVGGGGLAVGLVLLALPQIARPFYVAWYFVACCIGMVVGNLALAIVFFVLVTGIGLLMRALGRRPGPQDIRQARGDLLAGRRAGG